MQLSRREFLKMAAAAAAAAQLNRLHFFKLEKAFAAGSKPPVLWLSGAGCTGDSISLLNAVTPPVDQVLTGSIDLKFHPNLMAAAGDLAVASARTLSQAGGYILVVEGGVPTGLGGDTCYVWTENGQRVTVAQAVTELAAKATHIVAVGTCASFGGIPKVYGTTATQGVGTYLNQTVINLPGCPAHPDWIIGSLVQLIGGTVPALDTNHRPTAYYASTVHDHCPRRGDTRATALGQPNRCMRDIGCKGPSTRADCPTRKWNKAQNWCIGVNSPCIGCTESTFPAFPLR